MPTPTIKPSKRPRTHVVAPGQVLRGHRVIREVEQHRCPSGSVSRRALVEAPSGKVKIVPLRSLVARKCRYTDPEVRSKHGMSHTPTYASWRESKSRVDNPGSHSYADYGGRGIQMCEYLRDFANFLAYMGERPEGTTIDRRDVDGHYSCGTCDECRTRAWLANVRWATAKTQRTNTRRQG